MRWLICCGLLLVVCASSSQAAESLPLKEVDLDRLIEQTQVNVSQDNGMGLVWFLPETAFLRLISEDMPAHQLDEVRALLEGKCVVAIVRAQFGPFGGTTFFDKQTVLDGTRLTVKKSDGSRITMRTLEEVPVDLKLMINAAGPILADALGRMGENLHFYVFENAVADGTKVYDPYADEQVGISFVRMGRLPAVKQTNDTICDALFKPRYCANGKRAHVTWKFDPWTGERLAE